MARALLSRCWVGAGEYPTLADWANHLTTIFPDVRLKRFLEMRGADAGPWRMLCALPALWVGLLYDPQVSHRRRTRAAWRLCILQPPPRPL